MKKTMIGGVVSCAILSCLALGCATRSATGRIDAPDYEARMIAEEVRDRLAVPMATEDYAGAIETLGRAPDRYDYLYEAAFAHCYAAMQDSKQKRKSVARVMGNYHEAWSRLSNRSGTDTNVHLNNPRLAHRMIARFEHVLKQQPDHPFKSDILTAITELGTAAEMKSQR